MSSDSFKDFCQRAEWEEGQFNHGLCEAASSLGRLCEPTTLNLIIKTPSALTYKRLIFELFPEWLSRKGNSSVAVCASTRKREMSICSAVKGAEPLELTGKGYDLVIVDSTPPLFVGDEYASEFWEYIRRSVLTRLHHGAFLILVDEEHGRANVFDWRREKIAEGGHGADWLQRFVEIDLGKSAHAASFTHRWL